MKSVWFIIAALFPVVSFSQESLSKSRFNIIASVGVIAGESAAKPLFQLTPGISYDRWFAGIGIGLDQYKFNSIPLFADLRMHVGKARAVFLYANGGYNFSYNNKSDIVGFYKTTDRFYGGFYMDAGIGYRIKLSSSHRLLFSAGYSQKNLVNKVGFTNPGVDPPPPGQIYYYHYHLGRIVTKLSWEFGK
jgi:hypothetical protein